MPNHRQNFPGPRNSKRRGELAELAFLHKAASLGFGVAKAYGDSERYDFILDSGPRLWRVQVKSAATLRDGAYYINAQRVLRHAVLPYSLREIDFLVAYIVPENAWFIIPVAAVSHTRTVRMYPRNAKGEYARYHEAWDLMRPHG